MHHDLCNIRCLLNKWCMIYVLFQHLTVLCVCAFLFFQLSINAFDYNCHVDLIKLLKQEGELLRLRKARQKMSELFPLTEGWWTFDTIWGAGFRLIALMHNLQLKTGFFEPCRNLARLAQGRDPTEWWGAKPGESLWTIWESCKGLYLWVHTLLSLHSFWHSVFTLLLCSTLCV